ncbi:MAG TPA: hypothetical protein EYP53_09065 [Candidatus Latescibacteria bacterium]|nr:hypothetical protein [Candidatus Latescibacterota bacterium]
MGLRFSWAWVLATVLIGSLLVGLWILVFHQTGILQWGQVTQASERIEPPLPPQLLQPDLEGIDIEKEIADLERQERKAVVKSQLLEIKCECGCGTPLALCNGGRPCPVARRQMRELGIEPDWLDSSTGYQVN